MTPLKKYHLDLELPDFQSDPSQAKAIAVLDKLHAELTSQKDKGIFNFLSKPKSIQGVYLWGQVGAGKTYLMDTFYQCLSFEEKMREHFHEFMRDVHVELKKLQGETDPLKKYAKQLRKKVRVICFDEFFVKDIADAMLLGRLFTELFAEGVTLVATSNVKLDDLYKNGLQRDRFLPAIELLKQHLQELHVGNDIDYRLQHHEPAGVYFSPLNENTEYQMKHSFVHYTHRERSNTGALTFNQHPFQPIMYCPGVAWFEFAELCDKPRSAADYLAITEQFHTVLISNVPHLTDKELNATIRFINLIDVFYDEQVRLVISSAKSIEKIYTGEQVAAEFKRTASRLFEMQDVQYLEKSAAKKYIKAQRL